MTHWRHSNSGRAGLSRLGSSPYWALLRLPKEVGTLNLSTVFLALASCGALNSLPCRAALRGLQPGLEAGGRKESALKRSPPWPWVVLGPSLVDCVQGIWTFSFGLGKKCFIGSLFETISHRGQAGHKRSICLPQSSECYFYRCCFTPLTVLVGSV